VSEAHARGSHEHLTVLDGELAVMSGDTVATVAAGGIARYPADVPHAIRNETAAPAQAILVVLS
jgi:mannose-6-phosphate isomerase-like protein (cupin superfamily)